MNKNENDMKKIILSIILAIATQFSFATTPANTQPQYVDRETLDPSLTKATHEELDAIRDRVATMGIPCQASYRTLIEFPC